MNNIAYICDRRACIDCTNDDCMYTTNIDHAKNFKCEDGKYIEVVNTEVGDREKALRLLLDWAIECGFGYDNIPEEYEKYEHEIEDMNYTEGLIYIAEREAERQ